MKIVTVKGHHMRSPNLFISDLWHQVRTPTTRTPEPSLVPIFTHSGPRGTDAQRVMGSDPSSAVVLGLKPQALTVSWLGMLSRVDEGSSLMQEERYISDYDPTARRSSADNHFRISCLCHVTGQYLCQTCPHSVDWNMNSMWAVSSGE